MFFLSIRNVCYIIFKFQKLLQIFSVVSDFILLSIYEHMVDIQTNDCVKLHFSETCYGYQFVSDKLLTN